MTTDILLLIGVFILGYQAYLHQRIEVAVWEINEKLDMMQSKGVNGIWIDCPNRGVTKFVSEEKE